MKVLQPLEDLSASRWRAPNKSAAPGSPSLGEMYYDTVLNQMLYWNGTAWTGTGTPVNMVTTNTVQTISGAKTFSNTVLVDSLVGTADAVISLNARNGGVARNSTLTMFSGTGGGLFIENNFGGPVILRSASNYILQIDAAGKLQSGDLTGSSLLPAYSFTNDPSSGMYMPSGGQLGWSTGGVQRLLLDGNRLTASVPLRDNNVPVLPASGQPGDTVYLTTTGRTYVWNGITSAWDALPKMGATTVPMARAYQGTIQGIPNTTYTPLTFDQKVDDTDSMWASGSNTRLTINTPGRYVITADASFVNAGGSRGVWIRVNGPTGYYTKGTKTPASSGIHEVSVSDVVTLKSGDYVEAVVWQDSGGTLNTGWGTAAAAASLSIIWAGGAGNNVDERGVPALRAIKTAPQTIPITTVTPVNFDAADDFDTDSMHDPTSFPSRFIAKTPGIYSIDAQISWVANTSGIRQIGIRKNGTISLVNEQRSPSQAGFDGQQISCVVNLAAGEYVEVTAYQNVGSLNITDATASAIWQGSGKTVIPSARVYHSVAQTPLANATETPFVFNTEVTDNDNIHDTVANTGRLTCRTAGSYHVWGNIRMPNPNTVGTRVVFLKKNGTTYVVTAQQGAANAAGLNQDLTVSTIVDLAVGDYIELYGYHSAGAGVTITVPASDVNNQQIAAMGMTKIGQTGPGLNNDPGWATSGPDLQASNAGNVKSNGVFIGKAVAFSAWRSGTQALTAGTPAKISLNTEESPGDSHNFFDSTTNFRFQPTVAGWYDVSAGILFPLGPVAGQYAMAMLYKNGSLYKKLGQVQYGAATQPLQVNGTAKVYLNGSTDYIELWGQSQTAVTLAGALAADTFMQGVFIGY